MEHQPVRVDQPIPVVVVVVARHVTHLSVAQLNPPKTVRNKEPPAVEEEVV
jgi:hypothetical protein